MGFINKDGELEVEARYDYGEDFKGELALMVRDNLLIYVNREGEEVWTAQPLLTAEEKE